MKRPSSINLRLHWRAVAVLLAVIVPLGGPASSIQAAATESVAISTPLMPPADVLSASQSVPIEKIEPRRTIPDIAALPHKKIADYTEDSDFFHGHVFAEPLVPKRGKSNLEENKSLARLMNSFSKRTKSNDFLEVEQFVKTNPNSRWTISLLANLATAYFKEGYFTKALATWEQVWKLGKDEKDPDLKLVVDRAVAELAKMNARIGRFDRMESLFKEVGSRELRGSASEIMVNAKDAWWLMKNQPGELFRCGPIALGSLLAISKGQRGVDSTVDRFKSTSQGTSLAQLAGGSKELGLNYQMAKRAPGAAIITSAIVNWKVGHYAVVVSNDNGVLHIQDPTFAEDLWISANALDTEASGYFLVPSGALPDGWSTVQLSEGKNVWGKGGTSGNDPDREDPCDKKAKGDCGSCGAMAKYDVHSLLVSLNITDTPVFYNVPVGPSADFTITYNQRESHQTTFNYANFGLKWTCNLVSYITDNSSYPTADATLFVQGGGVHTFSGFNSGTNSYAPGYRTQATLVRTATSPVVYELRNIDGSKQVFSVPNSVVGAGRKVFLTQTIDTVGNTLTYTYSGTRTIAVTDAKGQVTTVDYKSNTAGTADYYRIGKVTNPFGKFATFDYNVSGQLSVITDMIGIYSAFEYGSSDFINKLTTPYGATTFTASDSGSTILPGDTTRWLEVTDPLGAKERVEYRINAPGIPVAELNPPARPSPGATNSYLYYRNTFFWSKKAMMEAPGDYTKAKITHWLHTSGGQASGTIESEKEPLESRVYNVYSNQGSTPYYAGPNELLIAKGRKLDDGTDQVTTYDYNTIGNKTKEVDPLGRTTNTIYDTNGVDVLEINQTVGATTQVLTSYRNADGSSSYNSQHLPLRKVDAAGQVTTLTYNANGQVLTTSRVRNGQTETTTRTYVTNTTENGYGQVKTITGPIAGATTIFTYDGLSRVQSVTDSAGYTLAYEYDALNRQTKVAFPDGTYEQTLYNKLDAEWKRDRLGRWSRTQHDALQRPTLMTDAEQRTTEYKWCSCGSLKPLLMPVLIAPISSTTSNPVLPRKLMRITLLSSTNMRRAPAASSG